MCISIHRRYAFTMTDLFINKIIRDEIDHIDASDSEKNLIYSLLDIERRLSNMGKTKYMKDYRRAVEDAAGVGYK